MRKLVTIDCETDPFDGGKTQIAPFIWGIYSEEGFAHYPNFGDILKYLLKFDEKMVVYAHNAGRFDYLFKEVVQEIPNATALKIINGRLGEFKIGDITFRDSLLAIPIALKSYKKDDIEYWKMSRKYRQKYMPEIIKYLEGDCVYLYELMEKFREDYGPRLTLASSSMRAMTILEGIPAPKSTEAYFRDLKPFYYGGRVQTFAKGKVKGPIFVWDINSAYPYAMTFEHPWGGYYHKYRYRAGEIEDQSCVEINCESHGAFPFGLIKGGTSFPDDGKRRNFRVTGWEYNNAKALGLLGPWPVIHNVFSFPKKQSFKKYVNHFYDLRKRNPKGSADNTFGKLFMNSLYGKMGMDGSEFWQYQINELAAAKELGKFGWVIQNETEDQRFIYTRPEPRERWRFYEIGAALSVTGFVRAMGFRAIIEARRDKTDVYYLDTDGLQTGSGWKPTMTNELGDWKLETCETCKADHYIEGFYGGKKLYALKCPNGHWKKAHKGAVLTGEQVASIAADGVTLEFKKESPSMGILTGTRYLKRNVKATF